MKRRNEVIVKVCALCGRDGVRQYREADSSDGVNPARDGHWVCTNDRACRLRRETDLRALARML